MRRLALVVVAACSARSAAPRAQLRFRGEGLRIAGLPDGGAVVTGTFAVETALTDHALRAPDDHVNGVLARLAPDGRVVWAIDDPVAFPRALAVARDGRIAVVAEAGPANQVLFFDGDGHPRGDVQLGAGTPSGAAFGDDGTLYVTGALGEQLTLGATTIAPVRAPSVYVAAIDAGGRVRWARALGDGAEWFHGALAVARDRVVVASGWTSGRTHALALDALALDGAPVAHAQLDAGSDVIGPALAPQGDGVVVIPGMDAHELVALDRDLHVRWRRALPVVPQAIATAPDAIYVAGGFGGALTWGGTEYHAADASADALVARLAADGAPAWLVQGRGAGAAFAHDVAVAGGGVVWATGGFDGETSFGSGAPLAREPDGIQSGFAIALSP